jgi:hypothetical protein
MKCLVCMIIFLFAVCFGKQSTIDLDMYKKSKKHSFNERSYVVGKHTYRIVNIKPLGPSDTNCIAAVVLDKRKYVLFDVDVTAGPFGMIVPAVQPIEGGLIILKASPYDSKVFLLLPGGKVVTLPGASVITDTIGKCVYCVWNNDNTFRLTVFDYKNLRLVIQTTEIAQPKQWYLDGMSYGFVAADGAYYTIDFMLKNITKGEKPASGLATVSYVADLGKIDRTKCCSAEVMKK